jgi:hypothetical protein
MLNKSGESGHPCFIPIFRGKGFSFYLLIMMLTIVLSYIAFIMLRYLLSNPSFIRAFIRNGVEFYQVVLLHLLRWSSGFVFASVTVLYYIFYSFIHMCIHCLGHFFPLFPAPFHSPHPLQLPGRTCSALSSNFVEEKT